jgi:ferritin-like metal-binding protein YciE
MISPLPGSENLNNKINLGSEKLKTFFVRHLNRIYSAKAHLFTRLPQLLTEVHFSDLRHAIQETIEDVGKQMARMEVIYAILDAAIGNASVQGLSGMVDDAFDAINENREEPELRDLSIIFYLQNIESVEMASFQVLQMAAVKLKNKQIDQLLQENYAEAKADRTLLLLISSKYIIT